MKYETYQNAFSRLEPSQDAVIRAMHISEAADKHRRPRVGAVLLAAVLSVVLLTGAVFAAAHFHWFTLGSAEHIVDTGSYDPEAFGKTENLPPEPQAVLSFENSSSDTLIGFRLPDSYRENQYRLECRMLKDGLYRRYYANDPWDPSLTIEILDQTDRDLLIRDPTQVVKEGFLNNLETVWMRIDDEDSGKTQYILFQKNEDLGCLASICSTAGFEAAEQAAADMVYEDSGVKTAEAPEKEAVRYGWMLRDVPEGFQAEYGDTLADDWSIRNAILCDPDQDLTALRSSALFGWEEGDLRCNISLELTEDLDRFSEPAPIATGRVCKTGALLGHQARWVERRGGRKVFIQVYFPEQRVELTACVSCIEKTVSGDAANWEEVPVGETWIEAAEQLLSSVDIVPVPIEKEAPGDFAPFVVG